LRLDDKGKYRWHWDPRFLVGPRDLAKRSERLEACARNLTLPTLLVRGGLSDVLSEAGAAAFKEMCPHSEYVNITGAGHMVAGDRNDVFGTAVVEFLARAVPVGGSPLQSPHEPAPHHAGPPGDINDIP
jgi:non-heme chloroperoxidase